MTMKNNENIILLNSDPFDPKVVPDTKTEILTQKERDIFSTDTFLINYSRTTTKSQAC